MKDDLPRSLRSARANMIGTDDEDLYWTCQDAAFEIESLRRTLEIAVAEMSKYAQRAGFFEGTLLAIKHGVTDNPRDAASQALAKKQ